MKTYFNTKAFDEYHSRIHVTKVPAEAELLVMGAKTVNIEEFSSLKAVFRFGIGTDNVPFDYLAKKAIPVHFPSEEVKAVLYDSTANFAAYLILKMCLSDALGDADTWTKFTRQYLGRKQLLVIGMGNIGSRVYKKMSTFMNVSSYDISHDRPEVLQSLIRKVDCITLHIPMTDKTKNIIDAEKLGWMKPDAVLVNTARGALVNEEALYHRLQDTNFRAAFDVFWVEPYRGKLCSLPRDKFMMTPHCGSQTQEFVEGAFEQIVCLAEGER